MIRRVKKHLEDRKACQKEKDDFEQFRQHPGIKRLWRNTELDKASFDSCYLTILRTVIDTSENDEQRDHILRLTSGLMVARMGFRMGRALPIEDSSLISNRFTLALVACVMSEIMAQRVHPEESDAVRNTLALAKMAPMLGPVAFDSLMSAPIVFADIGLYFAVSEDSEIRRVISAYFTREKNCRYRYLLPNFAVKPVDGAVDEVNAGDASSSATDSLANSQRALRLQSTEEDSARSSPTEYSKTSTATSTDPEALSAGRGHLRWLKAWLAAEPQLLNGRESPVHVVAMDYLFVEFPRAFTPLMIQAGLEESTLRNQIAREKKHVRTDEDALFHKAKRQGKRVSGLMFSNRSWFTDIDRSSRFIDVAAVQLDG